MSIHHKYLFKMFKTLYLYTLSKISNNKNKPKMQNKRSNSKTTIDDNYHTSSEV